MAIPQKKSIKLEIAHCFYKINSLKLKENTGLCVTNENSISNFDVYFNMKFCYNLQNVNYGQDI